MSATQLLSGSWRLRHDEVRAGDDVLQARDIADPGDRHTVLVETTLEDGLIPLAICGSDGDPTHLVLALDTDAALMVKRPAGPHGSLNTLLLAHHLRLNNNECDYRRFPTPPTSGYRIIGRSPGTLGLAFSDALAAGALDGYRLQFRHGPRQIVLDQEEWSTSAGNKGVVIDFRGRRRAEHGQPVISVSAWSIDETGKRHVGASLESRRSLAERSTVAETMVGATLTLDLTGRRTGIEIPVECMWSGHIFAVAFEHLVVRRESDDTTSVIACVRISYARSRGDAQVASLQERMQTLDAALAGWLAAHRVTTCELAANLAQGGLA